MDQKELLLKCDTQILTFLAFLLSLLFPISCRRMKNYRLDKAPAEHQVGCNKEKQQSVGVVSLTGISIPKQLSRHACITFTHSTAAWTQGYPSTPHSLPGCSRALPKGQGSSGSRSIHKLNKGPNSHHWDGHRQSRKQGKGD